MKTHQADDFESVSAEDIECTVNIAHDQLVAMSTIFSGIARLCGDPLIAALCRHGANLADIVANDIDILRERAVKAGVKGGFN